jgi:carbon starvation protein CstA
MKSETTKRMGKGMFWMMMLISFLIMYIVKFLDMDAISHYHTSLTWVYMELLMVTPIAIVMMLMMGKMYPNKKLNTAIIVSCVVVFILVFAGLQIQTPVGDLQYMKSMIPHHSRSNYGE